MTGGVEAGSRNRKLRDEICNQKPKEEIQNRKQGQALNSKNLLSVTHFL